VLSLTTAATLAIVASAVTGRTAITARTGIAATTACLLATVVALAIITSAVASRTAIATPAAFGTHICAVRHEATIGSPSLLALAARSCLAIAGIKGNGNAHYKEYHYGNSEDNMILFHDNFPFGKMFERTVRHRA